MSPEPDAANRTEQAADDLAAVPLISDWIWHPWYAKLWWALIPIYWLGATLALKVSALDPFYSSALAGFINVLMFPPTVLMILGAGYVRERIGPICWSTPDPSDFDHQPFARRSEIGRPPPELDPLNPTAGAYWIGSPTNSLNKQGHIF
jgi:hypothetical protein